MQTPQKRFNANAVAFGGTHPYVVRTSLNNGRRGCILADARFLSDGQTISFGQDTATIFYQDEPYFTGDKIKVLKFKPCKLDAQIAVYLLAVMRKAFSSFAWGISSFNEEILKSVPIELPIATPTAKMPDFEWMRKHIRALERAHIRTLESTRIRALSDYLLAAGFGDTELTTEEREALAACPLAPTKTFKIGTLYHKVKLPKMKFDKRRDASTVRTEEFSVPLVNAKHGDNGIMFYGRPEVFDSEVMTIDIVQNGAVATGDVYPQPQRTGVLWDAYLIKASAHTDTERTLCFMACAIEKTIKRRFSYEKKATWERVKEEKFVLPVTETGSPDWDLMDCYIRAMMKRAIAGIVARKDRELEVTRRLVPEDMLSEESIKVVDTPPAEVEFVEWLPLYSLKAACGKFGDGEAVEPLGWVKVDIGRKLDDRMFVVRAIGRSMEPKIHDGTLCVMRALGANSGGSREGKIVLAQHRAASDPETGGAYSIKRYSSEATTEGDLWRHERITLSPLNPDFPPLSFGPDTPEDALNAIAEFIAVLPTF